MKYVYTRNVKIIISVIQKKPQKTKQKKTKFWYVYKNKNTQNSKAYVLKRIIYHNKSNQTWYLYLILYRVWAVLLYNWTRTIPLIVRKERSRIRLRKYLPLYWSKIKYNCFEFLKIIFLFLLYFESLDNYQQMSVWLF